MLNPSTDPYRLGPGDIIDIEVIGESKSQVVLGVGPDGKIYYSLLPGTSVWGVLFLMSREQHAHLDRTEGVGNGLYSRLRVDVEAGTDLVVAETLISELRDPSRRPSHRYRSLLIEGAREHGLPVDYLRALEGWPLAWDERDGAVNVGAPEPSGRERGKSGED